MKLLLRLIAAWLLTASGISPAAGTPVDVFVSIPPQKYIVERVGGEHVRVRVMVGPGESPATFEPRPRQMAELADAVLYYRIGVPFEQVWMPRLLAMYPRLAVLDARRDIPLREMEPAGGHGHDDDHQREHGEGRDPHVWLDPGLVRVMITHLRDRLAAIDPAHAQSYRRNQEAFDAELIQLEAEIRRRLDGAGSRRFMVFHPSWGYFADAFGLQQIPIESEGKEPGARTLARLLERAREEGIGTIFVQRQFSQTQARSLADALGAGVAYLDPLAEEYMSNLLRAADAIAGERR